jgi:hypothetical protein
MISAGNVLGTISLDHTESLREGLRRFATAHFVIVRGNRKTNCISNLDQISNYRCRLSVRDPVIPI